APPISPPAALSLVPYDGARHGDQPWQGVSAVWAEYGFEFQRTDYEDDLVDPATHYGGGRGWFMGAEDAAGRVAGCIGLTDEGDGLFEVHRLYVLAETRRSGTGSALLRRALELALERNARRVELFSDIAFLDAHRLYRRFGFRNHR